MLYTLPFINQAAVLNQETTSSSEQSNSNQIEVNAITNLSESHSAIKNLKKDKYITDMWMQYVQIQNHGPLPDADDQEFLDKPAELINLDLAMKVVEPSLGLSENNEQVQNIHTETGNNMICKSRAKIEKDRINASMGPEGIAYSSHHNIGSSALSGNARTSQWCLHKRNDSQRVYLINTPKIMTYNTNDISEIPKEVKELVIDFSIINPKYTQVMVSKKIYQIYKIIIDHTTIGLIWISDNISEPELRKERQKALNRSDLLPYRYVEKQTKEKIKDIIIETMIDNPMIGRKVIIDRIKFEYNINVPLQCLSKILIKGRVNNLFLRKKKQEELKNISIPYGMNTQQAEEIIRSHINSYRCKNEHLISYELGNKNKIGITPYAIRKIIKLNDSRFHK